MRNQAVMPLGSFGCQVREMLSITKQTHKSCATPCNQDLSLMPADHHSSRMFWTLTFLGVFKAVAGKLVTNHQTFLFSFQLVGILIQVWLLLILAWNLNFHLSSKMSCTVGTKCRHHSLLPLCMQWRLVLINLMHSSLLLHLMGLQCLSWCFQKMHSLPI